MGTRELRKFALLYLLLSCLVLGGIDISISRTLRQQDIQAAFQELRTVARVLQDDLTRLSPGDSLNAWAERVGRSGPEISVFSLSSELLAEFPVQQPDSPGGQFHPEVQAALASGRGESVRPPTAESLEQAYLASGVLYRPYHPGEDETDDQPN